MESKSVWTGLIYGGIASCIAEVATLPIDTTKTRMQLQGEGGAKRQYKSVLDAVSKIVRNEGFGALYKGLAPALLRQATYGSMRYGFYGPIKSCLGIDKSAPKSSIPLWKKIVAGTLSGAVSSAMCNPTDLIKVRMQADGMTAGSKPRYSGLLQAFKDILKREGIPGLYKGVGPTCSRAAVLAASELSTYDEVKEMFCDPDNFLPDMDEGLQLHATTATVAGFVSAWCSSPFDVVKSRVMNAKPDPTTGKLPYTGMLDCMVKSVQAEGITCLWKGFWPNFARIGPRVVIIFICMEQLRDLFD